MPSLDNMDRTPSTIIADNSHDSTTNRHHATAATTNTMPDNLFIICFLSIDDTLIL